MLWLTWRQHRAQVLITTALLVAIGVAMLVLGLGNADTLTRLAGDPEALDRALQKRFDGMFIGPLGYVLPFAPAAIGLFWGTPVLGREFDRGTQRLAWTQSVSLRRWLAVKLGVLATAVVLAGLAFGAMTSAWLSSFGDTPFSFRFRETAIFSLSGIVPAAWWLFSFVVGVAAGALFRRTAPAMAVTFLALAVLLPFLFLVRSLYAPAERVELDFTVNEYDALTDDSLIVHRDIIDSTGKAITDQYELDRIYCSAADPTCSPPTDIRQVVYYHPPSRYWQFQWTETAWLVTVSIGLGALAIRRTARSRI